MCNVSMCDERCVQRRNARVVWWMCSGFGWYVFFFFWEKTRFTDILSGWFKNRILLFIFIAMKVTTIQKKKSCDQIPKEMAWCLFSLLMVDFLRTSFLFCCLFLFLTVSTQVNSLRIHSFRCELDFCLIIHCCILLLIQRICSHFTNGFHIWSVHRLYTVHSVHIQFWMLSIKWAIVTSAQTVGASHRMYSMCVRIERAYDE